MVEIIQGYINNIRKIHEILNLSKNTTTSNRWIMNTLVIHSRIATEGQQEDLHQYFSTCSSQSTEKNNRQHWSHKMISTKLLYSIHHNRRKPYHFKCFNCWQSDTLFQLVCNFKNHNFTLYIGFNTAIKPVVILLRYSIITAYNTDPYWDNQFNEQLGL
jgi:hypothetical protein